MSVDVKICGLTTPDALEVALDAGADLVGFVFYAPSPRHLELAAAGALGRQVGGRAAKVALTVNADDEYLAAIVEALTPDWLQFHGVEAPVRVAAVRQHFGIPVMKALAVEAASDLARVPAYADVADRLLFDARAPLEATRPGGLGRRFDWMLLQGLDPGLGFMLSGGLDAGNVATALAVTRAAGVDVSSGVERAAGQKDPDMIRAFIAAVRATERSGQSAVASTT